VISGSPSRRHSFFACGSCLFSPNGNPNRKCVHSLLLRSRCHPNFSVHILPEFLLEPEVHPMSCFSKYFRFSANFLFQYGTMEQLFIHCSGSSCRCSTTTQLVQWLVVWAGRAPCQQYPVPLTDCEPYFQQRYVGCKISKLVSAGANGPKLLTVEARFRRVHSKF
jgi:hypothetical protein